MVARAGEKVKGKSASLVGASRLQGAKHFYLLPLPFSLCLLPFALLIEWIDVLDEDGAATGAVKDKREVHRDGDWHRAAHLWIGFGDRVLLQRRALVKDAWPGLWDISVAGHVNAGERTIDAAIREAHEELGLRIAAADLEFLGEVRYQIIVREGFIENEIHEVYLLRRDVAVDGLTLDPAEVVEVRWVPLRDLQRYERVPHEEATRLLLAALGAAG